MGRWWWGSSYGLAAQMQQPASFLEGAMWKSTHHTFQTVTCWMKILKILLLKPSSEKEKPCRPFLVLREVPRNLAWAISSERRSLPFLPSDVVGSRSLHPSMECSLSECCSLSGVSLEIWFLFPGVIQQDVRREGCHWGTSCFRDGKDYLCQWANLRTCIDGSVFGYLFLLVYKAVTSCHFWWPLVQALCFVGTIVQLSVAKVTNDRLVNVSVYKLAVCLITSLCLLVL